jgi:hypothetical protein
LRGLGLCLPLATSKQQGERREQHQPAREAVSCVRRNHARGQDAVLFVELRK